VKFIRHVAGYSLLYYKGNKLKCMIYIEECKSSEMVGNVWLQAA